MDIESTHENLVLREFNKIPKGLSKENAELFYHILSSHEKPNILKAKNEFLQRKNEFNPRKKIRKQPTRLGPKRRIVLDEQTDGMIQENKVQRMVCFKKVRTFCLNCNQNVSFICKVCYFIY